MKPQDPQLSTSEYALLGFLLDGPCHGYELHKKMTETNGVGMIWDVKISNLYAQLEKLARRGLITGHVHEIEQRPARTEFSLTPEGVNDVNRWLHEPVEHPRDFRHDFLIRVYFISTYQPGELEWLIDRQLDICNGWLSSIGEKEKVLPLAENFANLTNFFRYSQIQSMMDWLNWLKTQIPTMQIQRGEK